MCSDLSHGGGQNGWNRNIWRYFFTAWLTPLLNTVSAPGDVMPTCIIHVRSRLFAATRASKEYGFLKYSNKPYSFSLIFEFRIYSNMELELQNKPYWAEIRPYLAEILYETCFGNMAGNVGKKIRNIFSNFWLASTCWHGKSAIFPFCSYFLAYIRILEYRDWQIHIRNSNFSNIHWTP